MVYLITYYLLTRNIFYFIERLITLFQWFFPIISWTYIKIPSACLFEAVSEQVSFYCTYTSLLFRISSVATLLFLIHEYLSLQFRSDNRNIRVVNLRELVRRHKIYHGRAMLRHAWAGWSERYDGLTDNRCEVVLTLKIPESHTPTSSPFPSPSLIKDLIYMKLKEEINLILLLINSLP